MSAMTVTPDVTMIDNSDFSEADAVQMASFLNSLSPDSRLRSVLIDLMQMLESGSRLAISNVEAEFTPEEVSKQLGISRPQVYKLMDRGEMPFHRVSPGSKHRRIFNRDVISYRVRLESLEQEHAQKISSYDQIRNRLIARQAGLSEDAAIEAGLQ